MLDEIQPSVEVFCLETGDTRIYCGLTVRTALIISGLQVVLRDFNSWDYPRKLECHHDQVMTGPSGKTASFELGGKTFSTILDHAVPKYKEGEVP